MSEDITKQIDMVAKKIGNDFDGLELVNIDDIENERNNMVHNRVDITSKEFSKLAKKVRNIWNRYEEGTRTWENAK